MNMWQTLLTDAVGPLLGIIVTAAVTLSNFEKIKAFYAKRPAISSITTSFVISFVMLATAYFYLIPAGPRVTFGLITDPCPFPQSNYEKTTTAFLFEKCIGGPDGMGFCPHGETPMKKLANFAAYGDQNYTISGAINTKAWMQLNLTACVRKE